MGSKLKFWLEAGVLNQHRIRVAAIDQLSPDKVIVDAHIDRRLILEWYQEQLASGVNLGEQMKRTYDLVIKAQEFEDEVTSNEMHLSDLFAEA